MSVSLLLGMSSMLAAHQVDLEAENTALKTEVQKLQHQVQKLQRQQAGAGDIWVQPNMEDIAASRPNIIIIFGDDIGYADLGAFGHPTARTPSLDHFASTGAKLTQYYSAANICSPSRGSLMTGRLYGRLGIFPGVLSPLSKSGLQLNETTIAAALKKVGYRTGGLGKWHLGTHEYLPVHHGFDYYFGAPMTQNECISNIRSPGSAKPPPGHSRFGPCPIFNGSDGVVKKQEDLAAKEYYDMIDVDEEYDAAVANFVREAHAASQKFFFYFCSHHTHVPQFATKERTGYSPRGLMGDSLSMLDRSVGRLMNLTAELDIDSSTLMIFSADNGGARYWGPDTGGVNGELRGGKTTTWEGGHRVPTMARWPGKIQPNSVNAKILSSLDWYLTIGYLAGYEQTPGVTYDGMNVAAALFTDAPSPRRTFFYHSTGDVDCQTVDEQQEKPSPVWRQDLRGSTSNCSYTIDIGYNSRLPHAGILKVSTQEECCRACFARDDCVVSAWHPPNYTWDNTSRNMCFLHYDRSSNKAPDTVGVIGCDTGRANKPPPPPPPARYCRPRVMAVRKDQYKLHMWTKGGGRPQIRRNDWPPEGVTVKTGYPDWMLEQPLTNWSNAPVLFDLHQDCGETVPRFPCDWDGTWPAKDWVSGCMPRQDYENVVAELTALYNNHVAEFPRVQSQIEKGLDPSRFPCCNAGCTPAPACCHCEHPGQTHLATHLGI